MRTAPSGAPAFQLSSAPRLGLTVPVPIEVTDKARPTLAAKNSDDAIFETYLKHANVTGYYEREARAVWALYKQLIDNMPLKDASRDDGRKLVEYFEAQNLKSATITKKVGWLTAGYRARGPGTPFTANRMLETRYVKPVPTTTASALPLKPDFGASVGS
jgi:hypothetical protein